MRTRYPVALPVLPVVHLPTGPNAGWPDGERFMAGCLLAGLPISLLLWWGILSLAGALW